MTIVQTVNIGVKSININERLITVVTKGRFVHFLEKIGVNFITNLVYVSDIAPKAPLVVINGKTNRIIDKITVGVRPTGVGVNHNLIV